MVFVWSFVWNRERSLKPCVEQSIPLCRIPLPAWLTGWRAHLVLELDPHTQLSVKRVVRGRHVSLTDLHGHGMDQATVRGDRTTSTR
jgi:hypothetical protein